MNQGRIPAAGSTVPVALLIAIAIFAAPTRSGAEENVLEEVIVTAQKREQNLLDVPVAVTALDRADLRHFDIENLLDISRMSPSVSFTPQQSKMSNNPLRIRGVGSSGTNPAFEGSVGIYIDGMYRSRAGMAISTLNDIESLEILRGPQGTLFGKNTSAGALVLRSAAPTETFEASATLEGGNFDFRRAAGWVSGPLGGGLTGRIALLSERRDGFIVSPDTGTDFGDLDTDAIKAQLAWENDRFRARLIADLVRTDEQCCFGNTVRITDDLLDELLYRPLANSVGLTLVSPADPFTYRNSINRLASDEVDDRGVVLDLAWDLETTELRSITAWRDWEYDQPNGDADFGPVDLLDLSEDYDIETLSQEFNWSGTLENTGRFDGLDFVAGAFFMSETIEYGRGLQEGIHAVANWTTLYDTILGLLNFTDESRDDYLPPSILATPGVDVYRGHFDQDDDVWALYGHATLRIDEHWHVVAGLRYNDEEKRARHTTLARSDPLTESFGFYVLGASTGGRDFDETQSDSEWTGNFALQYFTDNGAMVYASYTHGFKAGGVSLNSDAGGMVPSATSPTGFTPIADPRYQPEFVDAFELGFKLPHLDGRARTAVTAFYQDYSDIQFQVFTGTEFLLYNASDAFTQGVELENTVQWTDGLTTQLMVTWLNAEYGDDPEVPPNLQGRDLDHAPEWATSLGVFYERPLSDRVGFFGDLNWSYVGRHFTDTATSVQTGAYNLVNLRAGLEIDDSRWRLSAWCRNCFEEEYLISAFAQPFYFGGAEAAYLGAPRTYGLSLTYDYF